MKLNYIFGVTILIALLSCNTGDNERTGWSFQFEQITREPNTARNEFFFTLTISSSTDLLKFLADENGVSIYLFCPLSKRDFSPEYISERPAQMSNFVSLEELPTVLRSNRYLYPLMVGFEVDDHLVKEPSKIKHLIDKKNCVECKIVMAFMQLPPRRNITSEPFCIPVDSILKLISE